MRFCSVLPAALAATLVLTGCASAGELEVGSAWARATPPGATVGAVYLEIHNTGTAADRLLAITSTIAAQTELHGTMMHDGMAHMRAVPDLAIAAGERVALKPGALHVMLMGLRQPLVAGQTFTLELQFEHAGRRNVTVEIRNPG